MPNDSLQERFLNTIKKKCDAGTSFADDLAELLCISKDSAYRRLRGETPLQFDEIEKLCGHYKVSVDQLFNLKSEQVTFSVRNIAKEKYPLKEYLISILNDLDGVMHFKDFSVIFAAKDIPPFYYFQYPQLSRFKMFFWLQNFESSEYYSNINYEDFKEHAQYIGLTNDIWTKYAQIPSVEIWSDESVKIFLRTLDYYFEAGLITKESVSVLLDEFMDLIVQVKKMADHGKKMINGKAEGAMLAGFDLYYNEVSISDNTIYFQMDGDPVTFITYNMINILRSEDKRFCANIKEHLDNIIKKSTLISSVSEKSRRKYFNQMIETVQERINYYQ